MNIVVVVALALFLAGGLYHRVTTRSKVLSSQTLFPTPTFTPNETPTKPSGEVGEVGPTLIPKPTSNPTPTTHNLQPTANWQYPGSTQVSAGVYESSDPSDKITDWYQDKIRQLGLNIKTFVRTKTNNRVLNKLVGAGSQTEVQVEISKNPSDSVTRIVINY